MTLSDRISQNRYSRALYHVVNSIVRGVNVLLEVDATMLIHNPKIKNHRYDIVILNRPHAGTHRKDHQSSAIKKNQDLISEFLFNARRLIHAAGEIHISVKFNKPYSAWNVERLAKNHGLFLLEKLRFPLYDYPYYNNKKGSRELADKTFCNSSTYTLIFGTSSRKMPTLEEYGTNLTNLAVEGKLDPVVGRKAQIKQVIRILGRRTKNNPCLVGEPGVGKTAIAEGLAQRIANGDVPERIKGKQVIILDVGGLLVADTKYREEILKRIMLEVIESDGVILYIDEVQTLSGAGAAEGAIDAARILKPAIARGELQCIGAATLDQYRRYIEKDPAFEKLFQPVKAPK